MSRQANPQNRPRIVAAIRRGQSIKSIAYDLGLSISWTYKMIQELGYSAQLVSRDELNLIRKQRIAK